MTTTIAFFNNKGGVGKTTLAYHLAHMVSRLGHRVLAVDLDPQANLTSAFFDEERMELIWEGGEDGTVFGAVEPILKGLGDIRVPEPAEVADNLWVLPGDLSLSRFEDRLSDSWPRGYEGDEAAIRVTTAFHRMSRVAASSVAADVVLLDVGPNLGAINRSALLAADWVVIPLAADLFSLQGLRNLGPTLRTWRANWQQNTFPRVPVGVDAPEGTMRPAGYVVLQHAVRLDRPVQAYDRWLRRIPAEFRQSVLADDEAPPAADEDPYRLASLRNYRSLMPLAQDARKPMFDLRAADGALGSTGRYVETCEREFRKLARTVLRATRVEADPRSS
ncbi:MAG TPA: ParA family protein [Candidatus Dormibacteraeota bacterium]|jgi:cellulose biosynthesis protein BcsQ